MFPSCFTLKVLLCIQGSAILIFYDPPISYTIQVAFTNAKSHKIGSIERTKIILTIQNITNGLIANLIPGNASMCDTKKSFMEPNLAVKNDFIF